MEILIQIALNAIIAGAIYALLALGFNLIYSTARFFDLGYGALTAVGGYSVYFFDKEMGLNIFVAIVLGGLIAGILGFLIEKVIYKKLRARKASSVVLLLASLGVLTVVQAIIAIIFSSQFQTLSKNTGKQSTFEIFGGIITQTQSIILVGGLLIMISLASVFKYTIFGKAVRAVSDDEEVAKIVGINSEKIIGAVFLVGGIIAGLAGISVGFDTGIEPTMGMPLLLKGVVASVIGGVGNIYGGVLGAFLLGFIENYGIWYFSGEWKDAIVFAVLIIFLLFRPQGILKQ